MTEGALKSLTAIVAFAFYLVLLGCGGSTAHTNSSVPPPNPAGGEVTPNYFSAEFQTPYQAFMKQVVQHYGGNSSIGYIRFGLARGGETYPNLGFDSDPTCSNAFTAWGWTPTTWIDYVNSMLDYEGTLASPVRLTVGINTVDRNTSIPDSIAAHAVSLGMGFGSQGFQQSDISSFTAGTPCIADWCSLFATYQGQVPLELQTATQSDPTGAGMTGSLVDLLPFAVQRHATIVELYYQDWLTAFDPGYPGYDTSLSYAQSIQAATSLQLEVLHPPSSGTNGAAVQTYLMSNPAVTGANIFIEWATVDQGPGASPQYDWSSTDSAIQPWVTVGKKVNLVVWPVADSTENTSTPAYVLANLGTANTTTCIPPAR
jgi:hypothetical protein